MEEAKIIEINKESWDFITEPDAPDFAQKFDNLIKAYFNNAYLDKERFPNRGEIKFFLETLVQDNWLCKMPLHVPVFTYLKEIIKHTGEVEMIRLSCFWHCMEIINLIQDYNNYFGESESSEKTLIQAYAMLLKAHRKGFEAEKR